MTDQGAYAYGQLYVTVTRNENWSASQTNLNLNTIQEYKDKFDRVVLKRTFNYNTATSANETFSTYYIYDDYGNLTYVLPPGATPDAGGITQTVLDNLCYQYHYDGRNRLIEKKIPGKGWEYMVYNNLNQVVATQDSVQRGYAPQQFSYIKYDSQGRQIISGIYILAGSSANINYRGTVQATANTQTTLWETKSTTGSYSNLTVPTTGATILTTNYYDDYNITGLPATTYAAPTGASTMTRGLLTATQTGILNTPGDLLWTAHYYDDLGRVIKSYAQHYVGGHTSYSTGNYDAITNYYNFTNQLDTTIRQHYRTSSTSPKVTIFNSYAYDQVGRKVQTIEQITGSNGVAQTTQYLSAQNYNEIGQLYTENIDGSPNSGIAANVSLVSANSISSGNLTVNATNSITMSPGFSVTYSATLTAQITNGSLETIQYAYNERGWLTALTPSTGAYGEQLYYNKPTGTATPQYNGNISQFSYNSPYMETAYSQATNALNTVGYTYDNLNRLTKSQSTLGHNDETAAYDPMGNITGLTRTGTGSNTGTFTYSYNPYSNQLNTVSGLLKTYAYDGNGNATSDSTTKQLTYNMLNLPLVFSKGGTTQATYFYGADGNKLRNVSTTKGVWDYDNGIVYLNGKIDFLQTEEGKATLYADSLTYNYNYDLKDYLGNIRASYDNGGPGGTFRTIQENDYYPFGLSQLYYDNANGNRYLYNGKEQQLDLTNQYDYGARFYDPEIARWTTIDPLAEISRRFSPYNYGENNPIRNVDPDGMTVVTNADGSTTYTGDDIYTEIGTLEGQRDVQKVLQQSDPIKGKGKKQKGNQNQSDNSFWSWSAWSSAIPVWNQAGIASDLYNQGHYLGAAAAEINGVFELSGLSELGASAYNGISGLFTTEAVTTTESALGNFTASNFRNNLIKLTGENPSTEEQAHHVFPQKFRSFFEKAGINIDDPRFGSWWEASSHQKSAASYNKIWNDFLSTNPSKSQILREGRAIMTAFGRGSKINF